MHPTGIQKDTTFTKIFVGGLPYHTNDASLRKYFEAYGEIDEAVVITDRQTGKSRGYGFVSNSNVRLLFSHVCVVCNAASLVYFKQGFLVPQQKLLLSYVTLCVNAHATHSGLCSADRHLFPVLSIETVIKVF